MIKLQELFDVETGRDLIYSKLISGEYNVVGQSSKNNGVVCTTKYLDGYTLYKKEEVITVATYGKLFATVQIKDFYIGTRVKALVPKLKMSPNMLKYYAMCINMNKDNFSYGRVGGERLQEILIPSIDDIPSYILEVGEVNYENKIKEVIKNLKPSFIPKEENNDFGTNLIKLDEIFDIKYGTNLELNKLNKSYTGINFVSRTSRNNGVSAKVERILNVESIPKGSITVALGGSVLEAFLQEEECYSGRDVAYLVSKNELSNVEKLFYCMCIKANKEKYSYGRQANRTLKDLLVPKPNKIPRWVYEI